MRPIRFRVWHKADGMVYFGQNNAYHITLNGNLWDGEDEYQMLLDCGYILMQFTGLLDKNGKEIWEGDIISCRVTTDGRGSEMVSSTWVKDRKTGGYYRDEKRVIEFRNGAFRQCYPNNPSGYGWTIKDFNVEDVRFEVIGNIYSNPDLLKEPPNDSR